MTLYDIAENAINTETMEDTERANSLVELLGYIEVMTAEIEEHVQKLETQKFALIKKNDKPTDDELSAMQEATSAILLETLFFTGVINRTIGGAK